MEPINEEIRRLTSQIWETVLQSALLPEDAMPTSNGRVVSACVHISGAWNGVVALSCDSGMAAHAADVMFDLDGAVPSGSDLQDALGELTNMIGGNIKALLPEPSHLSLPAAVEGADYSVRILHSRPVATVPFRCDGHSIIVSLLEREAA